ncbi:MAG: hypothetical protein AAF493_28395 [Pseudomonadota bacterium]
MGSSPSRFRTLTYGHRAKIGMMIPSSNTASETQVRAMLPEGVSLHITRTKLTGSDEAAIASMTDSIEDDAELLNHLEPDLIFFHCTAATTFAPGVDDNIVERIERQTGRRAAATSMGLLRALERLNARTVSLVTPYIDAINTREVNYLAHHGFTVINELGLGIEQTPDMFEVSPERWLELGEQHTHPDADVCFLSCAATRAFECIEALEERIERPVLTSNQLAAWHALRCLGVDDHVAGFGRIGSL